MVTAIVTAVMVVMVVVLRRNISSCGLKRKNIVKEGREKTKL